MTTSGSGHIQRRFTAQDGLSIAYRDYGDATSQRTPLLCLAGLTRNARDFHDFASRHAPTRRVLCPDLRGRGASDYDPDHRNYTVTTYLRDLHDLLAAANAHPVVVIGTSLGGILAMGLAVTGPTALKAVVLNDVGPEIDPAGLARIRGYVGEAPPIADWDEAVASLRGLFGAAYPDLSDEGWLHMARAIFREGADGRPEQDYDPVLARALADPAVQEQDLWPLFRALEATPTLALRGALSDILSAATFDAMAAAKPDMIRVSVPNRGHVPLLDEPECVAALDGFIARF